MLLNMKDLLAVANRENFAVPAFNIGTGQILNGVMDKCEELKAPVILAIHPSELEFQGDSFLKMCIDRASGSSIPVCIHLDHSGWGPIVRAVRAGFTSVMIDASSLPFEENAAITKKVCELAHPLGVRRAWHDRHDGRRYGRRNGRHYLHETGGCGTFC